MLKALDKHGNLVHIDKANRSETYYCQICHQELIQKRGEILRHHFAHYSPKGKHGEYVPCSDKWLYDMSEWHYGWQERFPHVDIERVVENYGKKHIADLIIGDVVVEFQHSSISIEAFRERNDFYTKAGYKVIWIFDLSEEFGDGKIGNLIRNEVGYSWANPRKLFRNIDLKNEKATIYFQFDNSENDDEAVIELVTKSYREFKTFYTDKSKRFSIKEFVENVKSKSKDLFPRAIVEKPKKVVTNGKTIRQLWKDNYSGMIVTNLSSGDVMIINGKEGRMYTSRDNGRIIGKYCNYDAQRNFYEIKKTYYVVKDYNLPYWTLTKVFEDKEYEIRQKEKERVLEEERKKLEEEEKRRLQILEAEQDFAESYPDEIPNCSDLQVILKSRRESFIIVENMFDHKCYRIRLDHLTYFEKVDEISIKNGVKLLRNNQGNVLRLLFHKKIWIRRC